MGQQTAVAGGALRRMIVALTIAALMVTMMVAMSAPAFANQGTQPIPHGGSYQNNVNGSGHANSTANETGGDDWNVSVNGKAYGDGNN